MTRKYWMGVVFGMLVIFAVGTLVVRGVHAGTAAVSGAINSSLPMLSTRFDFDGSRSGRIERLQLMRAQLGRFDSAVVTVKLDSSVDLSRFDRCILRASNAHPFGEKTRFDCVTQDDSSRLGLVPFGHIEVVGDGRKVPLYVAHDAESDVRSTAYKGNGGDSGDVDIRTANGVFSLSVNGRELIHATGDSGGGSLVIRNAAGKPVVEIHGDSAGGGIRINDSAGHPKIQIHGAGKRPDHS